MGERYSYKALVQKVDEGLLLFACCYYSHSSSLFWPICACVSAP